MNDAPNGSGPEDDPPDEELGLLGDSSDPGLESDEDLDGERDADGAPPLHPGAADTT